MWFSRADFQMSSNWYPEQITNYISCMCETFLRSEFSSVSLNWLPESMQNYIGCNMVSKSVLNSPALIDAKSHWLHVCISFKSAFSNCPQISCLKRCKVTLIAIVWFFSRVCFQMFPQIACLNWCIITLVTFKQFFSSIGFHLCPKIISQNWYIVTLIAFVPLVALVKFFSIVHIFKCSVKSPTDA